MKKKPKVNFGMFDFVNVAMAAAEGRLPMSAFGEYVGAMHPKSKKKNRRKRND